MQQEEFESPTSRFVAECSIQLSYCCIYRKYYKIHLQHFHLKYIFKGNFRGKLTRKSLKPFNTNNFEIECVRFVAECSIQLSYCCIYRKYYKIHLQHFHLKYIFKGNFRGKLTRKSLKPFNTNNFEIECVRFVAEHSIQLSYWCIYYIIITCIRRFFK